MRRVGLVIVAALMLAGCGGPGATNAPIIFTGQQISGTYRPGPPASCGTGKTMVMGQYGSNASKDLGTLTVSDDGSISFQVWNGETFSGHGVSFRPGIGWDIAADLKNDTNQDLGVTGHLSC